MEREAARYKPQLLEAMACDIGARPSGAPHFDDVAGALRAVRRKPDALVADYDPAAESALQAVVAAERLCCPDIGWSLQRIAPDFSTEGNGVIRLRVEASPEQLDTVELLFAPDAP
jgi:hypothetical protein